MRVECIYEKLADAVGRAERVSGKHMTLPVLSCVLIKANKPNTLSVISTNLDLGIEIKISAKVEKDGIAAVPAHFLTSFISSLKTQKGVFLESSDTTLQVSSLKNRGTIKMLSHEDFPSLPNAPTENTFTINGNDFANGLKSVWYSASISGIKPELSSVYIYCEDENVIFVATDSFRLAEKKVKIGKSKDFGHILIPSKNIPEIIRTLESVNGDIKVGLNKNQISFTTDGIYLVSRVIDGVFPDYRQIIPKQHTTEAVVLKQDMVNTLKSAGVFSDKLNQVLFSATPKEKELKISTKNSDVGEASYVLPATVTGDVVNITFNHRYVSDCFQSINTDSVELYWNGLNKPMVIKQHGDKSFTYLVMPMNR